MQEHPDVAWHDALRLPEGLMDNRPRARCPRCRIMVVYLTTSGSMCWRCRFGWPAEALAENRTRYIECKIAMREFRAMRKRTGYA